ncbi:MAG: hypothetical protein CM15mP22_2680 [Gammaproteobacteria bacterium]|nr:MAG: hypothetical protein CM15mP22_2680 [Gammaproteobacteria bacterium]
MKKLILLVAVIFLASCSDESLDVVITPVDKVKDSNSDFNELRNAYFGDTHVHYKTFFLMLISLVLLVLQLMLIGMLEVKL